MLKKNIYINSASAIAAQPFFDRAFFSGEVREVISADYAKSIDPDYKTLVSPQMNRRLGRIIKNGYLTAMQALKEAECTLPDAILTGTGLGCLNDTQKFLTDLIDNKEEMLSPTSFIQSTHNTVGSQIAIQLNCHNSNFTYSQRYFSFENAILEAMLMLQEESYSQILVHSSDEMTDEVYGIIKKLNIWESDSASAKQVKIGEGSASFLLSDTPIQNTLAQIKAFDLSLELAADEITSFIQEVLSEANLNSKDIDAVILGNNFQAANDKPFEWATSMFNTANILHYKHLVGEFFTANAMAWWMAAHVLKGFELPAACFLNKVNNSTPKNILVFNQYHEAYYSAAVLSNV